MKTYGDYLKKKYILENIDKLKSDLKILISYLKLNQITINDIKNIKKQFDKLTIVKKDVNDIKKFKHKIRSYIGSLFRDNGLYKDVSNREFYLLTNDEINKHKITILNKEYYDINALKAEQKKWKQQLLSIYLKQSEDVRNLKQKFYKYLDDNNIDYKFEIAKTNSVYFYIKTKKDIITVRFSDHPPIYSTFRDKKKINETSFYFHPTPDKKRNFFYNDNNLDGSIISSKYNDLIKKIELYNK